VDQSYHQIRRGLVLRALKIFDIVSIIGVIFFSAWYHFRLKEDVSFNDFLEMRISVFNALQLITLMAGFYIFFEALHLYRSRRLEKWYVETIDIIRLFAICAFILVLWKAVFRVGIFDAYFIGVFFAASVSWFSLTRLALRSLLTLLRNFGRNVRHAVIVGTNERALALGKRFEREPSLGYHLIGFIDSCMIGGTSSAPAELLCGFDGFENFIRSQVVDEVVLCLPLRSLYREASQVAAACKAQGIVVRQMADLYGVNNTESGGELLDIYDNRRYYFAMIVKRIFDVGVSLFLVLALFPIFALVALMIRCDSPGPVFFVQERIGLNKRRFRLFKFRTMRRDAEEMLDDLANSNEMDGPVFKIKNDPRVTRTGHWLRKFSIDELPQLFNVLKGDMSLVGPRPLPVRDYEGFSEDWHRRRCSVRPGITCLWQVAGRNTLTFDRWMQLDMEYIDNWSLRVDLAILLRTVPAVFSGKGAA
jgi:exopolysaccharide biosynthesis polyprenyl glycosylphosphotransferase